METEEKTLISLGDEVEMHYKCTLEDGTVTGDSHETGETISFEVGKKTVLSGIDDRVVGMSVGSTDSFTLTPEEGYGDYFEDRIGTVPNDNFPAEFIPQLTEGMVIPLQSKDGVQRLIGTIKEVGDEEVTVDFNHPLAGQTLTFDVEIIKITAGGTTSEATEEGDGADLTDE